MHDLPLLEGYTYTSTPARKDGQTETGMPPRRAPLILIRTAANRYLTGEEASFPLTLNVSQDGILVHAPQDLDDGGAYRSVSNTSTLNLGAVYNIAQLGVTVGLRLAHRVRMANGDVAGRRKLSIEHNDLHLWLAHPGAIWDVDSANRASAAPVGSPGLRNAAGGTANAPGILRDDRSALAQLHALACSWYLDERRTASWALNACGFLPSFQVADSNGDPGSSVTYPTIGQLVTTITAAGQIHTVNTPITSVHYDRERDQTTWTTDWGQLDFQ
jgi:hypothetical protein